MKISSFERDIIVGSVLGDGYLQRTGRKNARLRFEHGAKQKEYLQWKVAMLKKFFQGKPTYLERRHPLTQRVYKYWRHQSQSLPYLGKLQKIFYRNGVKMIPENLEKWLTPLCFAVWYMDDGYYYAKDKNAYIYLGNVTEREAELVRDSLMKRFGLKVRVYRKKKGYAIFFPVAEVGKLASTIRKNVLDCFAYKLPL